MSAEILRNRRGNLVIPQVHMAAAPFAHGRFGGYRDVEFSRAGEANDFFPLDRCILDFLFSERVFRLLRAGNAPGIACRSSNTRHGVPAAYARTWGMSPKSFSVL